MATVIVVKWTKNEVRTRSRRIGRRDEERHWEGPNVKEEEWWHNLVRGRTSG